MSDANLASDLTSALSELANTVERLNLELDSVNALIERFQQKLRSLSVGIEVWLPNAIRSEQHAGSEPLFAFSLTPPEPEWERTLLGFAKSDGEWQLRIRRATYHRLQKQVAGKTVSEWREIRRSPEMPLLEASRDERIEALKRFPELVKALTEQAKARLKAIQDAKEFVK